MQDENIVKGENSGQLVVVARLSGSQRMMALRILFFDWDARSPQATRFDPDQASPSGGAAQALLQLLNAEGKGGVG